MKWCDPFDEEERRDFYENIWYMVLVGGSFIGLVVYAIWLITR